MVNTHLLTEAHGVVGTLSNGKDVRPTLGPPFPHVQLHGGAGVDWVPLVRVDGDTEEARVGVDQLPLVPDDRVPENAGVAEEGEISHILGAVELGGVDLADLPVNMCSGKCCAMCQEYTYSDL